MTVNGETFSVTCGHCLIRNLKSEEMYQIGTPVYQPCAFGQIISAAASIPELLQSYYIIKQNNGALYGMKWLVEQLEATLEKNFHLQQNQCGTVHDALLGPLAESDVNVDVGLLEITEEVGLRCNSSLSYPGLQSPELSLTGEISIE